DPKPGDVKKGEKPADDNPEKKGEKPDAKPGDTKPNADPKKDDPKDTKPKDGEKPKSPDAKKGDANGIDKSSKPKQVFALPTRDVQPIVTAIDREIDKRLAEAKVPASPRTDDAEFLRRVTLDLTGRIPTLERARTFLNSTEADKRQKLIDELLSD